MIISLTTGKSLVKISKTRKSKLKIWNLNIFQYYLISLNYSIDLAATYDDYSTFGCYQGEESNYEKSQCDNCVYGVPCMCVKILNVPGKGDVRGCYANPHNSLDHMVGTCFTNNYQGYLTPICYCDTPFCNTGSTTEISITSVLVVLSSSLYQLS